MRGTPFPTLDLSVYSSYRMWRMNGSIHYKTRMFKTRLTFSELVSIDKQSLFNLASKPGRRSLPDPDMEKADELSLIGLVNEGINNIPTFDYDGKSKFDSLGIEHELTPCLKHLINHAPIVGDRNRSIYILARFFKQHDVSYPEAMDIMLSQEHYKAMEELDAGVSRVMKSVYASNQTFRVGCKSGIDAQVMKKYCDEFCWFNEEFPDINFRQAT